MDDTLQSEAGVLAERIAGRTEALFQQYGYSGPIRQSQPEIWSESVIYRKGAFEWEISACLHPHDYPNSLTLSLSRVSGGQRQYAQLSEFFRASKEGGDQLFAEFMIYPASAFEDSLERLYRCFTLLLPDLPGTIRFC